MAEKETDFTFSNYPAGGEDSVTLPITFGPEDTVFRILVEVDPISNSFGVIVGNGPPHENAPTIVSQILADVSETVLSVGDDEEWNTISESDSD